MARAGVLLAGRAALRLLVAGVAMSCIAAPAAAQEAPAAVERVWFDFDQAPLGQQFGAQGPLTAARAPAERVEAIDVAEGAIPGGQAVRLEAQRGAIFFAQRGVAPRDWRRFEQLSFWVYRTAAEAEARPVVELEVQVYEADGKARFWRLVRVDHTGWRRYDLPLKWFRWGAGRIPAWDRVDRFGFYFREPASLWLDAIAVRESDRPSAATASLDDLAAVAFPGVEAAQLTRHAAPHVAILTDEPRLNVRRLADHLAEAQRRVTADFPPPAEAPPQPPTLIVFGREEDYRTFPARLAERLGGEAGRPASTGYTLHGVSTSFYDERFGDLRPVFTHEYVHGLLAALTRLPNQNEWFQEGFAWKHQLDLHPQDDLAAVVRGEMNRPDGVLPLARLLDGQPLPTNRHWQAMTVVNLLLDTPAYRARLPQLAAAFAAAGSTNLAPHLEPILGVAPEAFEAAWRDDVRRRFGGP